MHVFNKKNRRFVKYNALLNNFHFSVATTERLPECPRLLPRTQFLKEHGSHCYEFILGRAKEWQNAENDCQSKGGHLVTIRSYDEQNFIYQTLTVLVIFILSIVLHNKTTLVCTLKTDIYFLYVVPQRYADFVDILYLK